MEQEQHEPQSKISLEQRKRLLAQVEDATDVLIDSRGLSYPDAYEQVLRRLGITEADLEDPVEVPVPTTAKDKALEQIRTTSSEVREHQMIQEGMLPDAAASLRRAIDRARSEHHD